MTETSFGHGGAVLLWQITMFLAAVVAVLLAAMLTPVLAALGSRLAN
jgi:hypothetical protein